MSEITETKKTKVSHKQILPYLEKLAPIVRELRSAVEQIPVCTKRGSLMNSIENIEKKIAIHEKEISEEVITQYVGKHPELLSKLAEFAASDEGAKLISSMVTTNAEKEKAKKESMNKPTQKKKRL